MIYGSRPLIRMLGPRTQTDNIAAPRTGSESDTVNPLTRLPMYFYSEPSRIIVATYPAVPGIVITRNIALESLRVSKVARRLRATHTLALENFFPPLRETSKSFFFSLPCAKSGALGIENSFPRLS